MKSTISVLVICLSTVLTMGMSSDGSTSSAPKAVYVPDAETAVRVAEAILIPTYGKQSVESERPFVALLNGNVWTVTGTLPKGRLGGVATVEIAKDSACILRVTHGK